MSATYRAVSWTSYKKSYDLILAWCVTGYVVGFVLVSRVAQRPPYRVSDEILLIRALGTVAIILLHVALSIGPLARLTPRALPLLYNRRHLGVATFIVAAAHGLLALGYYHGFGVLDPATSFLTINSGFLRVGNVPFELFGAAALVGLAILAATSHDFWLKNLSPHVWKSIHMGIYGVYVLVVAHVLWGFLQRERSPVYLFALLVGMALVSGLHLAAGQGQKRRDDADRRADEHKRWIDVADAKIIPEGRAIGVIPPGCERIAIYRHQGKLSAISGSCAHQGGPLHEGRIIDGCVTCPWHGFQYRPEDGRAPPPFSEKLSTYRLKVVKGRVLIDPQPCDPGTALEPVPVEKPS